MYTIENLLKQKGIYLDNITVDGKNHMIDFYLNFSEQSDSYYTFQDNKENNIAVLDPLLELIPKYINKGVFETIDQKTNKKVSIQFYQTIPINAQILEDLNV